jgi:hypothetical protein
MPVDNNSVHAPHPLIASAASTRALLARTLAALEAAAEGADPTNAVTDLPRLIADIRSVLCEPVPPRADTVPGPLVSLLHHCRHKAHDYRQALRQLRYTARTARTADAAAYWQARATRAAAKPNPWRARAVSLREYIGGGEPDREHMRGLLGHCRAQMRRAGRVAATLAAGQARARVTSDKWAMRLAAVEAALAELAARGPRVV